MKPVIISQLASELQNHLKHLDGEITPEIETLMVNISKSADDAGLFLDESEYLINYFKGFRDQISAKIKTIQTAQEFIEGSLGLSCSKLGDLSGDSFTFKLQKTKPRVVIDDDSIIEDNYIRTTVTHAPDKTKIYEHLKSGVTVVGAKLVDNFALKKTINSKKLKDV